MAHVQILAFPHKFIALPHAAVIVQVGIPIIRVYTTQQLAHVLVQIQTNITAIARKGVKAVIMAVLTNVQAHVHHRVGQRDVAIMVDVEMFYYK